MRCARLFRPHPALARHLPHPGEGFFRWHVASCGASEQWRSRLLAPRLGRGSLCGNGWWVRLIFGRWCRFAQDDTVGRRGVGCELTVGVGGMHYVGALACFALIRRWRATFPTRGKASFGCANLFCSASRFNRKIGATSQSYRKIGAVSNCYEPPRGAFPRVGKVARQCRMRAKSANVPT